MDTIIKKTNDCLLESFSETFNILDSSINELRIHLDEGCLVIEIYMKLSYPQGINFKLSFRDVKQYSFCWNDNYIFYNIESYKFFKANNLFYISFDPDGEENIVSQNDKDFILCENIEGSFLNTSAGGESPCSA